MGTGAGTLSIHDRQASYFQYVPLPKGVPYPGAPLARLIAPVVATTADPVHVLVLGIDCRPRPSLSLLLNTIAALLTTKGSTVTVLGDGSGDSVGRAPYGTQGRSTDCVDTLKWLSITSTLANGVPLVWKDTSTMSNDAVQLAAAARSAGGMSSCCVVHCCRDIKLLSLLAGPYRIVLDLMELSTPQYKAVLATELLSSGALTTPNALMLWSVVGFEDLPPADSPGSYCIVVSFLVLTFIICQ